jgi:RHS repeat-associated protein
MRNRLVAVNDGTHRSEFSYDGLYHRVRIVEEDNGVTTRDARLIWAGGAVAEERLSTGEITRFFSHGEQHNGTARYLTLDHLGSVREVTDAAGAVVTRNDYDPYGRLTRVAGTEDSRFGYTGHMTHAPSGLLLAQYRAYGAGLGRWLNEDPAGMTDGPNRFAYVANRSVSAYDPDGRAIVIVIIIPPLVEAAITAGVWIAGTYAAVKTGEAISDAIKKSQDETGGGGARPWEDEAERKREDKMEQARNPPKRDPKDYPKNKDPYDKAQDIHEAQKGNNKGGVEQIRDMTKAWDRTKRVDPNANYDDDDGNSGMALPPGPNGKSKKSKTRCP